jgi:UDP:flavonoid glycosyltransferase YjiC (YdhE family)
LAHRIYEGLSKTGYPVIWAFKSSEPFEVSDDNVYISSWLPQTEILSLDEIKVFVTHGGWNSISEGICYGKPLGLIPFFADQPTNAKIVEKNGSGLILYIAPNPLRVH